jgi:glutathione synthase/RimK-type ligase-like ATP-grasp enzyme
VARIGFLACETTLPSAGEVRRGDAFEHDLMIAALEPALAALGLELEVIDWEAPLVAFTGIAAVLLGTAWNYHDKSNAFLDKLDSLANRGIAIHNPPAIVRWNIAKTYLKELGTRGAPMIPTLWHDRVSANEARSAMDALGCDKLVVKRQIGAGAEGQELLERGRIGDEWSFEAPAMLQPFLPAITERGELSFIFIDGALSHALTKRAQPGDYRIQSIYGGTERPLEPSRAERKAAEAVLAALPFAAPLYARIDMVAKPDGALAVMEVELIEPYLYPEQGPGLGEALAAALARRMA